MADKPLSGEAIARLHRDLYLIQKKRELDAVRAEIADLSREITKLVNRRIKLRKERERLYSRLAEPLTFTKGGWDSLAVPRAQLGEVVREWFLEYVEEHGTLRGAWTTLSLKTNVSAKELRTIVNGPVPSDPYPRKFITLKVADRILAAIGMQGELSPGGRINVVANPGKARPQTCDENY